MDPVPSCQQIKKLQDFMRNMQNQLLEAEGHPLSLPGRNEYNEKN